MVSGNPISSAKKRNSATTAAVRLTDRGRDAWWAVGSQRAGHAKHRQRDNSDGSNLEAVQPARAEHALETHEAVGEQDQGQCRRQRETCPGGQRAQVSGAGKTD